MSSADWGHSLVGLARQWAKVVSLPASPVQFRQDLKFTSQETLRKENRCSNTSSGEYLERKTWEVSSRHTVHSTQMGPWSVHL